MSELTLARQGTRTTAAILLDAFGSDPFTSAEGHALGITPRQLEQAARSGSVVRLRRGLYAVAANAVAANAVADDSPHHLGLVRAAAERLVAEGTVPVVISWSAATFRGMQTGMSATPAMLAIPTASTHHPGERFGILLRKWDIPLAHQALHETGVRLTTPLRTGIDMAREPRVGDARALAYLCLGARNHVESTGREVAPENYDRQALVRDVRAHLPFLTSRGRPRVRAVLDYLDPRPENYFEALSWARIALAGLPLPECQVWLQGASGCWYRVDFFWRGLGLIGEADGAVKYASAKNIIEEKRRQADLEAAGYRFIRWIWEDVASEPRHLITRLRELLATPSAVCLPSTPTTRPVTGDNGRQTGKGWGTN